MLTTNETPLREPHTDALIYGYDAGVLLATPTGGFISVIFIIV